MMSTHLEVIPNLSRLELGQVSLGVPVRQSNNAIQLGRLDRIPNTARLDVCIEPGLIVMRREDEEPIQLESFVEMRIKEKEYETTEGFIVFSEPLGRLTLRQPGAASLWSFQEVELTPANVPHLNAFAKLIGTHALQKQRFISGNPQL